MELTSSYNFPLVSFSVFIAVLASYVALELTKRMTVPITYDLTTVEQINPSLKSFSSSLTPYLCGSVREAKKTVPVFPLKAIFFEMREAVRAAPASQDTHFVYADHAVLLWAQIAHTTTAREDN